MKNLSRRNFLQLGGLGILGAASAYNPLGNLMIARAQSEITLQTWGSFITTNNALLEGALATWAATNDASVNINFTGFDALADTLSTAAATGAGPDAIMMLHARPHQFSEALVDVSDIVNEIGDANSGWFGVAEEACMVDGVWRSVPFFVAAHAMVYREDLFAEVGFDAFPETYDDLLVAGTALKEMGMPLGFSLGRADGDGNNFVFSVLWSFGGAVTDADDNIVLDSAETRMALEYVQQLYNDAMDPNVATWDDGANNRAYLAGEVSCTNNASSILWAGRRDGVDFIESTNHALYPAGPAGRNQFGQVHSFGILNSSENIDATKEMLSFINSDTVWQLLGADGFAFLYPLFRSLEDDESMAWNAEPKLGAFKGLAEDVHTHGWPGSPSAAASQVASDFVLSDMFGSVAVGAASIDEAIATAVEQIEDIYGA
ncbi:MAG: extracellular solute-binding protein [Chloroflexota bacterium]